MVIRMKMAQTGKTLAVLLALLLLLGLVPVSAVGLGKETAEPPAQPAAEPTFTEVDVDGDTLKAYLELDGNYKINVIRDITVQIGEAGNYKTPYVDYWANLGTGTKVLNLNGHEIAVSNDSVQSGTTVEGFVHMCSLFGIGSGAELVVNDPGNEGKITYKCELKKDSHVNYYINYMPMDQDPVGQSFAGRASLNIRRSTATFSASVRGFHTPRSYSRSQVMSAVTGPMKEYIFSHTIRSCICGG